jgi:hypothetical protein
MVVLQSNKSQSYPGQPLPYEPFRRSRPHISGSDSVPETGMLDFVRFPGPLTAGPPLFTVQQFHKWRARVTFIIVSNLVKETDGFITRPHLLVTTSI